MMKYKTINSLNRDKLSKKVFISIPITALLLLLSMLLTNSPLAQASEEEGENPHIYDKAELLSTDELTELEELCIEYGDEAGIEIIILTHDDRDAVDGELYIEDFYDTMLYGDSVILLVDMHNRDVVLEGYGLAETYIHSKRGDVIIADITPYLSNGEYYKAFKLYIESSSAFMKDDSELNYDHSYTTPAQDYGDSRGGNADSILRNIWLQLFVSLLAGGITVGIMAYSSGGRMTAGSSTYIDPNHSGLIGRKDIYLRTRVTRIKKPNQDNNTRHGGFNSGGFRGGVSRGGHSHSTSRGKF